MTAQAAPTFDLDAQITRTAEAFGTELTPWELDLAMRMAAPVVVALVMGRRTGPHGEAAASSIQLTIRDNAGRASQLLEVSIPKPGRRGSA